jgi:hypothetical protein
MKGACGLWKKRKRKIDGGKNLRYKKREMKKRGRHGKIDEDMQRWRRNKRVRLKEKRTNSEEREGKDRGRAV